MLDAARDGEFWNMWQTVIPGPGTAEKYVAKAIAGRNDGSFIPFVVIRKDTGAVVGSTRYSQIDLENRKLEIGHTWLSSSAQRTKINTEAKLLLLGHAFEEMGCVRVQFTTDELNERSSTAILRLGAKPEGVIWNDRIMPNGRRRNSLRFSILDSEWPQIKFDLRRKLNSA